MTIVVGINFGDYVLLAADTRTTLYNWSGEVLGYEDASQKIQKTTVGLITGAGYTTLLDSVKRRLVEEEVTNTDMILGIIREERDRTSWGAAPKGILERTGWILSYRTIEGDALKLRLGMVHPCLGTDICLYKENEPAVIWPLEVDQTMADGLLSVLRKSIRPSSFSQLPESISHHGSVIATMTKRIQPICPSISTYLQFGVLTADGRTGISSIVKGGELGFSIELSS